VDTGTLRGFPAIEYSQKVALISHLGDGAVEMIDDCSLSLYIDICHKGEEGGREHRARYGSSPMRAHFAVAC